MKQHASRGRLLDLAVLTLICAIAYAFGLTSHGLTNWQEAQRAQATREMHEAGNWLYPTINHQPYIAKPPLFYWAQLALAKVRGVAVGEWEIRATVALAGWLGVVSLYLFGRRFLIAARPRAFASAGDDESWARDAALFASAFLATGLLYVRSSRIGELDILLAPSVTIAAGSVVMAWLTHRASSLAAAGAGFPIGKEPPAWGWLALATFASVATALIKGPPGLLAIAVAGYGGIVLWAAFSYQIISTRDAKRWPAAIVGAVVTVALTAVILRRGKDPVVVDQLNNPFGWPLLAACGAGIGAIAASLTDLARLKALWLAATRTHIVSVLGAGVAAVLLWGRAVGAAIGPEAASAWANKEAEDNLNLLVPASPVYNIEAMSYGVGLGSIAAIVTLVFLVRRRPALAPAWFVAIAWTLLGFVAFSALGKGVARYLTPLWPGVALLGGCGFATMLASARIAPGAPRWRAVAWVVIVALAVGQGWWYGDARERYFPDRSARAIVKELLDRNEEPTRFAAYEWRNAMLDYYVGARVESVGDTRIRDVTSGGKSWTLDEFREQVRSRGPFVIFVRTQTTQRNNVLPVDELRAAGLSVEPIETSAKFTIENGRVNMAPVRVRVDTNSK
ncbi:MAG: hypothetical protein ACOYN0_02090 [Phycisphaerales bacterium]